MFLVLLKPLVLAVTGLFVWIIASTLNRIIPEGKVKTFLYKQRGSTAAPSQEVQASMQQQELEVRLLESPASRLQ
jgi:hypothetical protein